MYHVQYSLELYNVQPWAMKAKSVTELLGEIVIQERGEKAMNLDSDRGTGWFWDMC